MHICMILYKGFKVEEEVIMASAEEEVMASAEEEVMASVEKRLWLP